MTLTHFSPKLFFMDMFELEIWSHWLGELKPWPQALLAHVALRSPVRSSVGRSMGDPSHHQLHPRGTDPFQICLLAPSPLAFHRSPEIRDLALNKGRICTGAGHPVKRTVQSPVARSPSCLISQTRCAKKESRLPETSALLYFSFLNSACLRQKGQRALLHFQFATSASLSCIRPIIGTRYFHGNATTCLPGPWDRLFTTWNCHSGTGCRRRLEVILEK